jgi:hypothetical protein
MTGMMMAGYSESTRLGVATPFVKRKQQVLKPRVTFVIENRARVVSRDDLLGLGWTHRFGICAHHADSRTLFVFASRGFAARVAAARGRLVALRSNDHETCSFINQRSLGSHARRRRE